MLRGRRASDVNSRGCWSEGGGGRNGCITALIYVSVTTLARHPYVICMADAVKAACVVNNGAKMAAERKPMADVYSFNQP